MSMHPTDAELAEAVNCLELALCAARNGNQAGEDALMRAHAAVTGTTARGGPRRP